MKAYFYIVCICLFFIENSSSQNKYISISGVVTSDTYNETVSGAYIHLKLSSGLSLVEKTDSTGHYEFKVMNDTISNFSFTIKTDKNTSTKTNKKCGFLEDRDVGKGTLKGITILIKNFEISQARHCEEPSPRFIFYKNSIISCNDSLFKLDTIYNFKFDDACNYLYKMLKENPTIIIELQGHTSAQEKNPEDLSLYRAQVLKEILVAKGINRKRIETKGWGSQKRLVKDDQINKAKTLEEKNALHTKNQRVVFRILSWDFKE